MVAGARNLEESNIRRFFSDRAKGEGGTCPLHPPPLPFVATLLTETEGRSRAAIIACIQDTEQEVHEAIQILIL